MNLFLLARAVSHSLLYHGFAVTGLKGNALKKQVLYKLKEKRNIVMSHNCMKCV